MTEEMSNRFAVGLFIFICLFFIGFFVFMGATATVTMTENISIEDADEDYKYDDDLTHNTRGVVSTVVVDNETQVSALYDYSGKYKYDDRVYIIEQERDPLLW